MARKHQYPPPFARARTIVEESYHKDADNRHALDHDPSPPEAVDSSPVEVAPRPPDPVRLTDEVTVAVNYHPLVWVPEEPMVIHHVAEQDVPVEVEDEVVQVVDEPGEQPSSSMEETSVVVEDEGQEEAPRWKKTMNKETLLGYLPEGTEITLENTKAEIIAALEALDRE